MSGLLNWRSPRLISPGSPLLPWIILANICFATIPVVVSAIAGFVAASNVRGALMLSLDDQQWTAISFVMMLGITLPLAVWFADKYGYKVIFFSGLLIFSIGSLFDGLATSFFSFVLSRIIAGIGGGGIFSVSIALIDKTFSKQKLPIAIALYSGFGFGFSAVSGFVISGYLTQYLNWESSFFFCSFLGICSLLVTWLFFQETERIKVKPFDFIGYFFFILFFANVLLFLTSGKAEWNTEGWTSLFTLTCAALAILGLTFLIIYELKHPSPVIYLPLYKIRSFLLGSIAMFFIGGTYYASQYVSSIFVDEDLQYEKLQLGLFLSLGWIVMGIMGSIMAPLSKKVHIFILTLIGMGLLILSSWMNMKITIYSSHQQMLTLFAVRMLGLAFSLGPAMAFSLKDVPKELAGQSSALLSFARQLGGVFLGTIGAYDIIVERSIFHAQMFGAQINTYSPRYQNVVENLQSHIIKVTGASPLEAQEQAVSLIRSNVLTQAQATAINDVYYLIGVFVGIITFFLIIEMISSRLKAKRLSQGG